MLDVAKDALACSEENDKECSDDVGVEYFSFEVHHVYCEGNN